MRGVMGDDWAVRWLDGTAGVSRATYGAATVNVADPDWPRSDAVPAEIMVIPFATAVARPLDSPTVATCGSEDDQTNPPLTIAFPFKSRPTAVRNLSTTMGHSME